MSKQIGLYIHIPFCKAKCNYCDFNSHPGKEALMGPYFRALEAEIALCGAQVRGAGIATVFIGGGTPSLAEPAYIYRLMNACRRYFNIADDAEISMEANPGTLTYEKLTAYKACGINRLSIGLQAWQDTLLKSLGRIHSREEFVENFKLARKAGFRNINVDLIFGLPGQTMNDWAQTIAHVSELAPEHISCYSLKIEEDTVFGSLLASGELEEPDDELDRRMYWHAVDRLQKSGCRHYEISNFARPGFECRHNLVYWRAEEYLGLGAGAHSYLDGVRYNNTYGIEDYIRKTGKGEDLTEDRQPIDKNESMKEYMLLGLRLVEGVGEAGFKARYGAELASVFGKQLGKLTRKQLLEREGDRWRLTPSGLDFANTVFMEFI